MTHRGVWKQFDDMETDAGCEGGGSGGFGKSPQTHIHQGFPVDSGRKDVSELIIPATEIAKDLGNERVANIVALSAFVVRSKIVDFNLLRNTVRAEPPAMAHPNNGICCRRFPVDTPPSFAYTFDIKKQCLILILYVLKQSR